MPKSYKHNGETFLVYHVNDLDSLEKVNKFTGDRYRTFAQMNQTLLLTLHGWRVLNVGDYVVHLFASEEQPKKLNVWEPTVYEDNGFLIVNEEERFLENFTPIEYAGQGRFEFDD